MTFRTSSSRPAQALSIPATFGELRPCYRTCKRRWRRRGAFSSQGFIGARGLLEDPGGSGLQAGLHDAQPVQGGHTLRLSQNVNPLPPYTALGDPLRHFASKKKAPDQGANRAPNLQEGGHSQSRLARSHMFPSVPAGYRVGTDGNSTPDTEDVDAVTASWIIGLHVGLSGWSSSGCWVNIPSNSASP
jgi:hypothetical protein